jgi:antitoxin VapB
MAIHIRSEEVERLLADIAARKAKDQTEVLLELLRAEQQRLAAGNTDQRLNQVRAATRELRATLAAAEVVDPRSPGEILSYDESGLPR